jgi:hypothetical protein
LFNHGKNLSAGEIAKLLMMRRRGAANAPNGFAAPQRINAQGRRYL